MRRAAAAFALSWFALGCSVAELSDSSESTPVNECSPDTVEADCGSGSACTGGRCVAPQGQLGTVLLSVTPPTSTDESGPTNIGGVRFTAVLDGLATGGAGLQVALGSPARVSGRVKLDPEREPDGCSIAVELRSSERVLGLPATSYSRTGIEEADPTFGIAVPPGDYDIYVQPVAPKTADGEAPKDCSLVPQVFRRTRIEAGDVSLELPMVAPSTLRVTIPWPPQGGEPGAATLESLEGWIAELIDPLTGKRVSTRTTIGEQTFAASEGSYAFELEYSTPPMSAPGDELLVLRPPPVAADAPSAGDVIAPTMVWQRSGLEALVAGNAVLKLPPIPAPVRLEGFVEKAGTAGAGVRSTVLVTAEDLDMSSVLASYSVATETDAEGKFSLDVPPGTYRVRVVPESGSGFAPSEVDLTAPSTGKLVELGPSVTLKGTVLTPGGSSLSFASVQASAAAVRAGSDPVDDLLGRSSFAPRSFDGLTDATGAFEVKADPGEYDITVRPEDGTGYPWLVRTSVPVEAPGTGLGEVSVRLPVIHDGTVTIDGAPIPDALIRAYVYVGTDGYVADSTRALSVVQVAETRADGAGGFELLLPSRLQ